MQEENSIIKKPYIKSKFMHDHQVREFDEISNKTKHKIVLSVNWNNTRTNGWISSSKFNQISAGNNNKIT